MKLNCLCEPCIDCVRSGYPAYKHYQYKKNTKLEDLVLNLRKLGRLEYLGTGRHRSVYLSPSGKTVIKFPVSYDGIIANKSERALFTGKLPTNTIETNEEPVPYPKKENLAGCRMIGYSILIMTKVSTDGIDDEFIEEHAPEWAMGIDCYQVGWHPMTDELVAFDYSAHTG